ncbi:hypothetical protein V8C35DRAFT_296402 [Trichoderma chlorosporum]
MAKDNIQPDVLRSTEATPIAKLSPAIADAASLVVEGVVTVTWPYSVVSRSIAFILAERDPLHRRDKGQLRVEFHGAAGKALAASSLGGGDEVRLSLGGVAWEENQAWAKHPGILEWQLRFSNRLLLKVRRADTQAVDTIDVDNTDEEEGQEPPQQLREPSPTPSIEFDHTQFSIPLPRTPLSTIPSKRLAYESLGPGEYTSPAFIKRARVSYGSLFEGGFDIFDDEEPVKDVKKRKRKSRFSMNPTSWRYTSQSPSPEVEQEQPAEEEEGGDTEPIHDDDGEPVATEQTTLQTETPAPQPQPVMVDHGCQTRELSSSPVRGVQVIAESKSTGILLQPTPTHPWKHVEMDHVLQEPSPLSFDYAAVHDAHSSTRESEALGQPEMHLPHTSFDMPMDIDPNLQSHQADAQHHPSYDITEPPQPQEHGLHDAPLHDLAWVAETLAPAYPAVPTHSAPDFPQGSFDRSSFTMRASPSDETHTLVSAGHHGVEMHGYVQMGEAQRVPSTSLVQQDGLKPNNSYPERYEEDTETATVTATLGREGRSSPPQEESSTDAFEEEEEAEEEEINPPHYYDWSTGRWREGYPEEEEPGNQQYTGYEDEEEEEEEEEDDEEDRDEEEDEDDMTESEDEDASEEESESEPGPQAFHRFAQPPPPIHRPFIPVPKPAPAVPKEPIFISLLSDSEDDDDSAPAITTAKKEPGEEPALDKQDEVREQPSEQENNNLDEPADEDEDVDETMDETMDEAEDKSDFEEATEIRTVASRSSRRSSRISQLDGCDDDTLHLNEEPDRIIDQAEMDHPNLIISPKTDKAHQHVDMAETLAQVQEEQPMVGSPPQRRSSAQHELATVSATINEETATVEMRGVSKSPAPEPISVEAPAVLEHDGEAPAVEQNQNQEQEPGQEPIQVQDDAQVQQHTQEQELAQRTASLGAVDSTEQVTEPSLHPHAPHESEEMIDVAEAPAQQQLTTKDDLPTEDTQSSTQEIQPPNAEVEVEVDAVEDVEMQDDVLNQPREETEIGQEEDDKHIDQNITDTISKVIEEPEEPEVAAPSSPPATQTEPSHPVPMAVSALEEHEVMAKQLPTPLETQQEAYEENLNAIDEAQIELPLNEDGVKEEVDEGVEEDEFKDADEDMGESYEDAREEGGDDDDFAIEQQLMSEFQHYSSPLKAPDVDRIGQAFLQLPETIEEIEEEIEESQQVQQHSQHSHHGEHCGHDHHDHDDHHDHHSHHDAHERSHRRADPEMSITVQSLRSHCRAKRLSSDSSDSLLTDPSVLLAKASPTMSHRQCLLGDSDYLPQRSPRSPRNKADHSDPSIALAKSSPRESVSPKNAGASASLRARRGVRGSIDASILLAQSFSSPLERSPASPTASFRAGRRRSDKSDLSVQLATASFSRDSQQQQAAEEGGQEHALDAAQDAPATPRRDATPEPTVTGHNLRSPRKPAVVSSTKVPSVASSVAEDVSMASLKLQLMRSLRMTLPDCLPLKSLRTSLTKTADILAVATLTPRQPHRPKHGPRGYMLELCLTDPSVAPTSVNIAHIFRPHQASLPTIQAGDVVLLRRVQVVSMQGRGFGVRAGDASAWAVFEKLDDEMLPQIKGPPVEVADEEFAHVQGLRRWWGLQDDKSLAKIDKANQKMSQAVKDDGK